MRARSGDRLQVLETSQAWQGLARRGDLYWPDAARRPAASCDNAGLDLHVTRPSDKACVARHLSVHSSSSGGDWAC